MAIVAGFDVHRRQITLDALDTETGEVTRGRIDATPAAVAAWVKRFPGQEVHVAVEACTGWLFVCNALKGAADAERESRCATPSRPLGGPYRSRTGGSCRGRRLRSLRAQPGGARRGAPPRGGDRPAPARDRGAVDRGRSPARLGRSPATVKGYFYDPTGEKARAVKARYQGACRSCGAPTQPRNGKGDAYAYCKRCHPGAIEPRWTRELVLEAMRAWQQPLRHPAVLV